MVKWLILGVKLAFTFALVYYAFSRIDTNSAIAEFRSISIACVLLAIILLFGQFVLAAVRCQILLVAAGQKIQLIKSLDSSMIGAFFSQTFISFVGGDAMRIWRIGTFGINWRTATEAVLLDRILGFVGHLLVIVIGYPILVMLLPDKNLSSAIGILILLGVFGCATLIMFRLVPTGSRERGPILFLSQLSRHVNSLLKDNLTICWLILISVGIQLMNVTAIYVLALGVGAELSILNCFALVPPVLFLSLMPISVSGWGVRESALISAFSILNIPASQSLAISLSYGLCMVLVSLPGGPLWLLARKKQVP